MFNFDQVTGISNETVSSILQAVRKELVHLGDAGGDAEVDGLVANLNDESADNVGVDLVADLELLAGSNVGGLGDGGLKP
jgi:hypothetical protein